MGEKKLMTFMELGFIVNIINVFRVQSKPQSTAITSPVTMPVAHIKISIENFHS